MTIQVRVLEAQARRALQQIQGDLNRLSNAQKRASAMGAGAGQAAGAARSAGAQVAASQRLVSATNQVTAATAAAGNQATRTGAQGVAAYTRWGNQVQWVGRQLTYNFSIPIGVAGVAAASFALQNEQAMVRVQKVYGDTAHDAQSMKTEVDALGRSFEALSNHFGVNQAAVLQIAGDWAAAGASGIALARGVRLTLETMVLGELDAVKSTEALIAIQAQYGQNTEELAKTINTLNMVENETGVQMGGLIESMQRSAGTARSAGIDVLHLAALTAALVPASGSAASAGNGLRTMISRLLSPTKEAAQVMDMMGISTKDLGWQTMNGAQRLTAMAEAYDQLNGSQRLAVSSAIASRWQINRFDILMKDVINTNGYYQKALNAAGDAEANRIQKVKELNAVLSSNPQRLRQMWVILQNAMADVIQPLLPMLVFLAKQVADVAQSFADLPGPTQKFVMALAGILLVIGPITRYVGSIGVLFGVLHGTFARVATGATAVALGFGRLLAIPFLRIGAGFMQIIVGMRAATVASSAGAAAVPAAMGLMARGTMLAVQLHNKAVLGIVAGIAAVGPLAVSAIQRLLIAPVVAAITIGGRISIIAGLQSIFVAMGRSIIGGTAATAILWQRTLGVMFGASMLMRSVGIGIFTFFATTIPSLIGAGLARANFIVHMFMFSTLPALFTRGWTALVMAATRAMFLINFALVGGFPVIFAGMQWLMGTIAGIFWAGWGAIARMAGPAMLAVSTAVAGGMTFFAQAMAKGVAIARAAALTIGLWFSAIPGMVMVGLSRLPMLVAAAFGQIMLFLRFIGPRILAFVAGPWGWAIAAVIIAFGMFGDDLARIWDSIVSAFRSNAGGIANAFAPVVDFFNAASEQIVRAFNALPAGIRNALITVVRFVHAAAMQVYEWFQYMNPFVRHSPSLVESVVNGMAVINRSYASVGNAGAVFGKAAKDLAAYKKMASGLSFDEWSAERDDVKKLMPGGLGTFNALVGDLGALNRLLAEQDTLVNRQEAAVAGWERQLKGANDALDAQQARLTHLEDQLDGLNDAYARSKEAMQSYADSPIAGQRAMSDAIFENEMAQKRLRLEIMRMEDAGGSVEDLRNRLANLQGDIESLRSDANDLRSAGAGSDVLGPVNAEIAAMEAQYAALSRSANQLPINQMQDQLEQLQRDGERMDLENALQFDPLMRQIDQLANGMAELPFDVIVAGIQAEQREMARLQPAIDAATAAVNGQQAAVDQLKASRDAIQATYDAEQDSLQALQDEYRFTADAISEIEQALRQVSDVQKAIDAAENAKKAAGGGAGEVLSPAAQAFMDAEGGGFPEVGGNARIDREAIPGQELWADQSGAIDQFTKDLALETGLGLEKVDMFGGIKKKWASFKGWWGENVTPGWKGLVGGIGEIGSTIGDGLNVDTWGSKFASAGDFIGGFWDKARTIGGHLRDLFGPQFEELWDKLKGAIGRATETIRAEFEKWKPLAEPAMEAIGNLWTILKGVLAFVGGVLVAGFSIAFSALANIIGPAIDMIAGIIGSLIQIIRGIVQVIVGIFTLDFSLMVEGVMTIFGGLVSGIWSILKGAWGIISGIVQGIVTGIVDFFTWLWDVLVGHSIVPDMVKAIIKWFQNLWDNAVDKVKGMVDGVVSWFTNLKDNVVEKIKDLAARASDAWDQFRMRLWGIVVNMIFDILTKWDEIKTGVMTKIDSLKNTASTAFTNLKDNILGAFQNVRDNIGGIFDTITSKIRGGINGAIGAVNSLIGGLNKVADILPGLDWTIGTIPLLAAGGAIPGRRVGAGFATNGARAIVGEGNPSHPEFVIPTDPLYRDRASKLYQALGARLGLAGDSPELGVGGPIDAIKSVIGAGSSLAASSMDWIKNAAAGAVSTVLRPVKEALDGRIKLIEWNQGRQMARAGVDEAWKWATNADEAFRKASMETGGNGPWRKPTMNYATSSGFGMRVNPVTGIYKLHAGTDMAAPSGTPIFAAAQGLAQMIGGGSGLGNYVRMDHGGGLSTVYGHMSAFVGGPGAKQAGEMIGRVGSTGNSTGPHLHFEVRMNGTPTDPNAWMRGKGVPLAAGGIVRRRAGGILANIGEGRHDEAVIPLPRGWDRRLRAATTSSSERLQPTTVVENNTYNFYGDLEFPNVTDASDAEDFARNLRDLAGGKK